MCSNLHNERSLTPLPSPFPPPISNGGLKGNKLYYGDMKEGLRSARGDYYDILYLRILIGVWLD